MIVKKNLDIKLKYNLISKLQAPGFPYYACTRSYFRKIEITPVPREITPPPLLRYVPWGGGVISQGIGVIYKNELDIFDSIIIR